MAPSSIRVSNLPKRMANGEILALAALVLYFVTQLLFRYSTLKTAYPIIEEKDVLAVCESVVMALAIAAIATRPLSINLWQGVLAAVALGVLLFSGSRTGDYRLVHGYVLLMAVAGSDFKKLCRTYYFAVVPTLVVIMVIALVGFGYNKDVIPNSRLVFAYGFPHPNTVGCLLLSSIGAMTYANWDSRRWVAPLVVAIVAAVFSYVTLSSHASALLIMCLAIVNAVGHIPRIAAVKRIPSNVCFAVLVVVPLCLMGAMLASTAFYDAGNPLISWFNDLIHGRPHFGHDYYAAHGGYTHLGRKYVYASEYHSGLPFASVDSGYCYLALVTGLFSLYALFATYIAAAWRISRGQHNCLVTVVLLMQAAYLVVENVPLLLALNFSVLFLSAAFADVDAPAEGASASEESPRSSGRHAGALPASAPSVDVIGDSPRSGKPGKPQLAGIVTLVLAAALLATMGAAALYGWRYGEVDESAAVGHVAIYRDADSIAQIDVDDDMGASVDYLGREMSGTLKLAGADEDSMLFELRNIEFGDGANASDAVLLVRMPRAGMQGSYAGSWALYFSCPSQDKTQHSDWIIAGENGTACYGAADKFNCMSVPKNVLVSRSQEWAWEKKGTTLQLR